MSIHIALMNFIAPVVALVAVTLLPSMGRSVLSGNSVLAAATVTQLGLLWIAHAPLVLATASASTLSHSVLQGLFLASALWFWGAVFAHSFSHFWRALLALAITGKLFCLLGALLLFAPRPLYSLHVHGAGSVPAMAGASIEDQQFAGLLMLLACPLSYLLFAVFISSRALGRLGQEGDRPESTTRQLGRS